MSESLVLVGACYLLVAHAFCEDIQRNIKKYMAENLVMFVREPEMGDLETEW